MPIRRQPHDRLQNDPAQAHLHCPMPYKSVRDDGMRFWRLPRQSSDRQSQSVSTWTKLLPYQLPTPCHSEERSKACSFATLKDKL